MRRTVPLLAALLIAAFTTVLVSAPADAHGRRGGSRVGVFFGFSAPLFYPGPAYYPYYPYPGPSYYYPQPVYVPPPQYIEQSSPAQPAPPAPPASAAPSQSGSGYYWYYCPDSQTYYPYVQTCGSQWQQVVPSAGPPS
jgi:hypothetical protein